MRLKPERNCQRHGSRWVDQTLDELGVASNKLIGGTKGSHFLTFHPRLVDALRATASMSKRPMAARCLSCRLVMRFSSARPMSRSLAIPIWRHATPAELNYLMCAVQEVFPQVSLRGDVPRNSLQRGPTTPVGGPHNASGHFTPTLA